MMGQSPVLLVIDDEPGVLAIVRHHAQRAGFSVVTCTTGANAAALVREHRADAAVVDLCMPEVGGLEVLRSIRDASPGCQTILMTGYASIDTAVEAIKLGALDYLSKPLDFARLERLLTSVRDTIDRRRALVTAEAGLARQLEFCGMIGRSPAMQGLFDQIRRFAPHLRSALVSGETGTGKELAARALHAMGPRRDKPFVVIDCAASGDPTFEATLFGVASSATTGAGGRAGVLAAADGGVLFLDEVGNLPMAIQARLLRVIETGELHHAGGPPAGGSMRSLSRPPIATCAPRWRQAASGATCSTGSTVSNSSFRPCASTAKTSPTSRPPSCARRQSASASPCAG